MQWFTELFAKVGKELSQTFRSLAKPAFRRYAAGQLVSLTGSQVNAVALAWTTYSLTQSASKLGMVALATYLPVLLLSLVGGMVADRFDRRRVLVATQLVSGLISFSLAALAWTGGLSFPVILAFGLAAGIVAAIDLPCRQAFVFDVVGRDDMVNAVGINSFIWNFARLVGPALAALLLAFAGPALCFAADGVSFLFAITTLVGVVTTSGAQAKAESGPAWTAGLRVLISSPRLRNIVLLVGCTSFFAFQYSILMPVFIGTVLAGDPTLLGVLTSCAAAGSICGNLFLASRGKKDILPRVLAVTSITPGIFLLALAFSGSTPAAGAAVFFLGGSIALQIGSANSYVQLTVPAEYRGRVMSIYTSVLIGAVPIGSLFLGQLADIAGVPRTLVVCAVACLLFALFYVTRRYTE